MLAPACRHSLECVSLVVVGFSILKPGVLDEEAS
jgi:hypothetical protein